MPKPTEEKIDFLRNMGGCCISYLRAGNDKTKLEEVLRTALGYVYEELHRLGLSSDTPSMRTLPDSKPEGTPK